MVSREARSSIATTSFIAVVAGLILFSLWRKRKAAPSTATEVLSAANRRPPSISRDKPIPDISKGPYVQKRFHANTHGFFEQSLEELQEVKERFRLAQLNALVKFISSKPGFVDNIDGDRLIINDGLLRK